MRLGVRLQTWVVTPGDPGQRQPVTSLDALDGRDEQEHEQCVRELGGVVAEDEGDGEVEQDRPSEVVRLHARTARRKRVTRCHTQGGLGNYPRRSGEADRVVRLHGGRGGAARLGIPADTRIPGARGGLGRAERIVEV